MRVEAHPLPRPTFEAGALGAWLWTQLVRTLLRVVLGVTFVVALTVALGGPIAMGLAIGCALAFVGTYSDREDDDASSKEDNGEADQEARVSIAPTGRVP